MKNIEEIIEMMKSINPDIKMDDNFKKSLKNKLEVTNYAKIKNTKNKKINIAKKGFFSLKRDGKSIFEKPSFNFLKILSSIFVGAFAVFGFINFYGTDLFILEKGGNLNYEIEKIEEATNTEIIDSLGDTENIDNLEEEERPVSEDTFGMQETGLSDLVENIPEIYNFIKFCEDKKGIIKNDNCEYGGLKCSKIDFEKNKCN